MENEVLEINKNRAWRKKVDGALAKTPEWLKKFFYSDWFYIVMSAATVLSWCTGIPLIMFATVTVLASTMAVVLDDITPGIPMILFAMTAISSSDISSQLKFIPIFSPIVAALIFHVIYYKARFKIGKMFWPQIAISIAMLLGGITCISAANYLEALGYTILLGLGVLLFYVVFYFYCKKNRYIKSTDFIAKALVYIGVVIFIEILVYYSRLNIHSSLWAIMRADLGWGRSTNISMLLLITTPMCFYFASKSKYPAGYLLLGAIHFLANFLTFSRGGILFGIVVLAVTVIYNLIKTENKKQTVICYSVVAVLLLIVYFSAFDKANGAVQSLLNRGVSTSGRLDLYKEAWQMFCKHPIFGVGMGFKGDYYEIGEVNFYWFHSTFFQIIGSTGLVGVAAFAYFYIERYKIIFLKAGTEQFNAYIFFAFLGFELFSMIDTGTFIPVPFMTLLILINMLMEKDAEGFVPVIYKKTKLFNKKKEAVLLNNG